MKHCTVCKQEVELTGRELPFITPENSFLICFECGDLILPYFKVNDYCTVTLLNSGKPCVTL